MELTKEDKKAIEQHPVYIQEPDEHVRLFADTMMEMERQIMPPASAEYDLFQSGLKINKGGMPFCGVIRYDDDPSEPYLDITPVGPENPPHCIVPVEEFHDPFLAEMPLEDVLHYKAEEVIDQAFLEGKLAPKELQAYECLPEKEDYAGMLNDLSDAVMHPDSHASVEELGCIDTDYIELALIHVNNPEYGPHSIIADLTLKAPKCDIDADFTLPMKGLMDCRSGEMLRSFLESQITAASHRSEGFGVTHDFLAGLTEEERLKRAGAVIEEDLTKLLGSVKANYQLEPEKAAKLIMASVKKMQKETEKQSSGR